MTQPATVTPIRPNTKIKSGAEFVTGSSWFTTSPRALPPLEDDLRREGFTHEIIEQMLHDPDVYAGIMLLVLMALNEKLLITPALQPDTQDDELDTPDTATRQQQNDVQPPAQQQAATQPAPDGQPTPSNQQQPADNVPPEAPALKPPKPVDPKIQRAADIAAYCERQVARVRRFNSAMFQMVFEGLCFGNKVSEQIVEDVPLGGGSVDAGFWCLKDLKPKPRTALAFVVDVYMNELGFLGAKPGEAATVPYNTLVDDADIIPREKFAVFTYRPKDNDPRGTSHLTAALSGWDLKRRAFPEYLLFMMVCAIPGILATLPANADEITVYEDDGTTPKRDVNGEVIKISAHQFLLNMLGKMRNHQVAVAPDGTNFTTLEAATEGDAFGKFFAFTGSEITHAILFQDLATKDAEHQTKGSTSSQFSIVDLIVFWIRDIAADMVRYDIFKPLVRYNFGDEDADELLPRCSYGDTEARNWATDATAVASLKDALEPSQWDFVTAQLGIPPPTAGERALRKKKALMPPPMPVGGKPASDGKPAPANTQQQTNQNGGDK